MDFSLNESERDLVDLCRDFAQKEIAPRAPLAWEEDALPNRSPPGDGRARASRHPHP